jgi:hypothetical protein
VGVAVVHSVESAWSLLTPRPEACAEIEYVAVGCWVGTSNDKVRRLFEAPPITLFT